MIGRKIDFLYFSPLFVLGSLAALLKIEQIGAHWPAPQSEPCPQVPIKPICCQEEVKMMNLLDYNGNGATIQLGQRELLLVMALIQEGRESFGCNTDTGKALDQFFCSANIQVEQTRRNQLGRSMLRQKISTVAAPEPTLHKDVSNG
jgi:hypothetical protein